MKDWLFRRKAWVAQAKRRSKQRIVDLVKLCDEQIKQQGYIPSPTEFKKLYPWMKGGASTRTRKFGKYAMRSKRRCVMHEEGTPS